MNSAAFAIAIAIISGCVATAKAQRVIVAGDNTPSFYLTNTLPNNATPGNRQFFTNVLGGGTSVRVRDTSFGIADTETNEFYNTLPGVSSSQFSGPVTPAQLAGADLLVMPFLDAALAPAEISAISAFLSGGGDLYVTGESSIVVNGSTSTAFVNSALTGLAVPINIVDSNYDTGSQIATGGQIVAHALTAGVTALNYGAAAEVNGGQPLLLTQSGVPFIAVTNVPEPLADSISLLFLVSALMRRGRR